jgi:hypothetical protein
MDKDILANFMRRFPMKALPNGIIMSGPVRISWPNLVTPRDDKGTLKYDVTLLWPLGADLTVLNKAIEAKLLELHGPDAMNLVRGEKIKWPLHDQAKKLTADGKSLQDGCVAGAKWGVPKTTVRPRAVNAKREELELSAIYPGSWALVTLHVHGGTATDRDTGAKIKYVALGLNNFQHLADDDRFGNGGGTDPLTEFDAIDGTAPTGFEANGAAPKKDPYDFG